ncbi:MAG: trypsin-like serine protease, partial [Deltaproteobacteria bacterium]|nr:trypsin-like serine protease [Deltaproteobacteria bacterium]
MSYVVAETPTSCGHLAARAARSRAAAVLALTFTLTLVACGPQDAPNVEMQQSAILGGVQSAPGAHPTVVSFVQGFYGSYRSFCTGTLISKRFVLTAAHCVTNPQMQGSFDVFFGDSVKTANASNLIAVESVYPHPEFDYTSEVPAELADWGDIALVKLSKDAPVEPMKMLRPEQVGKTLRLGADALVVGYGTTDRSNPFSTGTKYEGTMMMSNAESSEILLGGIDKGIACQGDSGGPTFMNAATDGGEDWRLVAVTSRGDTDCSLLSVQTRADVYFDWIHSIATDVICDSGNNPVDCAITPLPPAKKAFGSLCTEPGECEGDVCATVGDMSRCTQPCDVSAPDCPTAAQCVAGDDATAVCVGDGWDLGGIGAACEKPEDCASKMCAVVNGLGFCTIVCEPETGCGADLVHCQPSGDIHLCVPEETDAG